MTELAFALLTACVVTLAVAPGYRIWEAAGRPTLEEL